MHYETGHRGSRHRASLLAMAVLLAGCGAQAPAASDSANAAASANGAAMPGLASTQAVARAEPPQMASTGASQAGADARAPGVSDEEAVRAIVGGIYGWRDGRRVDVLEEWDALFSPRIRGLLAECGTAADNADTNANGGEGPYAVLGDQGCTGVPFLLEPVGGDPAPFIPKTPPLLRRVGPDVIEVEIKVPPADREYWGLSQTIRFQRNGGRWLIDDILTRTSSGPGLYSRDIQDSVAELRKIAKKPRKR